MFCSKATDISKPSTDRWSLTPQWNRVKPSSVLLIQSTNKESQSLWLWIRLNKWIKSHLFLVLTLPSLLIPTCFSPASESCRDRQQLFVIRFNSKGCYFATDLAISVPPAESKRMKHRLPVSLSTAQDVLVNLLLDWLTETLKICHVWFFPDGVNVTLLMHQHSWRGIGASEWVSKSLHTFQAFVPGLMRQHTRNRQRELSSCVVNSVVATVAAAVM